MILYVIDFCENFNFHWTFIILEYFYFWGVIFLIATTLIALFKSEKKYLTEPDVDLGIFKTYKALFSIMKLPSIKTFAIILLTVKVSFIK